MTATETTRRFATLHEDGIFVMPNPWDVGSARLLEDVGFRALATTSSGLAATRGRGDQTVRRDELLAHVADLAAAVDVPLSVDAERCFPDEPGGAARTVQLLADAGAAGLSVEDYDPGAGAVVPLDRAVEAVAAVTAAAAERGLVVTARAESHLYGGDDLDDTVARLRAYQEAGADVVYAPGVTRPEDLARLVRETGAPVNVLAQPGTPDVGALAALGVRRVSTGGALAWAAYGALVDLGTTLLTEGRYPHLDRDLDPAVRARAFH
ncbi:isocitrate lyase/phosphoenolpyruvate mutase family protein [Phycicoccus sp. BSK3Z-2]|uniref:Isocitrate lyase/phosphoenolpyruvate mutase family protein n=1 Tax=Phycicoccus avicenniae TaxID=2828860 RepID=A0A941D6K3_9MICO|nr:isocitrate lyase/phosphoenolpyruvate mutase family protein [Phycicoccus avicenniae]MBR7742053.1 isocitrate lyase/phosphoenolpyruvate mutase family protein [Phycicoccus avicenniae]